jgi:hypothetical protein
MVVSMNAVGSDAPLAPEERDQSEGDPADAPGAPASGLSVLVKVIGYLLILPTVLMLAVRYLAG